MNKVLKIYLVLLLMFVKIPVLGQNSAFSGEVKVRKTFDGSKEEAKPASLSFFQNHRSKSDFYNVDLAVKIGDWEYTPENSSLIIFPVIEWHKSTDEEDKKDKASFGFNVEFFHGKPDAKPFYIFLNTRGKRNFLNNVNEFKSALQLSFLGPTKKYWPGYQFKYKKSNEVFLIYFPYVGVEYNNIPDLITDNTTESFTNLLARIFTEVWVYPRVAQLTLTGVYRKVTSSSNLRKDLPFFNISLNFYPLKQDVISIGYDYKNGYDVDSQYQLVEVSSVSLKIKL